MKAKISMLITNHQLFDSISRVYESGTDPQRADFLAKSLAMEWLSRYPIIRLTMILFPRVNKECHCLAIAKRDVPSVWIVEMSPDVLDGTLMPPINFQ